MEKVLLANDPHIVAGFKMVVKKYPANYWIRAKNMPFEMSVKELCDIIAAQSQYRVAVEDVILIHGDGLSQLGEAVIKQQKRSPMSEPIARYWANMWTINAINAASPVRFEACRSQWKHVVCPMGFSCPNAQCWLGHPPEPKVYPRILNEGMFRNY